MLFNSPEFLLFLPIVFGLYWFVVQRNLKAQNMLLVIMRLKPLALILVLTTLATTADAQRRRPPRDDGGGQTPRTAQESIRSAEEKEAARTTELRNGYSEAKESHFRRQDKATRKRMKQNERRQKRARQGRSIPWWRRIFGKPNRYR
jgi:hypothetical protein